MNTLPARLTPMLLAFLLLGAAILRADDPAAHFPEIAQVTADYPDEAQRSAAFSLLSDALTRAEPRPVSKDAYNKIFNPGFIVPWLFECLILVTISFLILTLWVKSRIFKKRDGAFQRRYLPGFRQFFEQGTPILQRTFGR